MPTILEGYNNTTCIPDLVRIKSTSAYVFTIRGGAITCKLAKQTIIVKFTMQLKFITVEQVNNVAKWLKNFLDKSLLAPCLVEFI